jgi:hypothetical protein
MSSYDERVGKTTEDDSATKLQLAEKVAEGAGFEPARVLTPYAISSRAH